MLVCPGFEFEEASKHSIHLGCQCVQVLCLNITRKPMEAISFRTVEDGGKSTTMKTGPELKLWVTKLMFTCSFHSSLLLIILEKFSDSNYFEGCAPPGEVWWIRALRRWKRNIELFLLLILRIELFHLSDQKVKSIFQNWRKKIILPTNYKSHHTLLTVLIIQQ